MRGRERGRGSEVERERLCMRQLWDRKRKNIRKTTKGGFQ